MCLIFIDVSYSMLVSLLQQLAHVAHIERMLVERCLQYLNNCDVIALVEEVQMADFYVVTERVSKLLGDKDLKTECVQYVKATGSSRNPCVTMFSKAMLCITEQPVPHKPPAQHRTHSFF
eukprot:m.177954 g.177954  ORF g.177954 m.177954 type:complete len:120 (+) comp14638_c0_seq4:204-563(+)